MRSSGESEWYEYRHTVPLTGREPVLGRLRERLRHGGTGLGWVTLTGGRGAGVTRLLDEVAHLLVAEGQPGPLVVLPVAEAATPLEPLRRVLVPLFRWGSRRALERSLRAVLPASNDELRVLASWLIGSEAVWNGSGLDGALVGRLLRRVAGGIPLLVHDPDRLDPQTFETLLPAAQGHGPGVIAGVTGSSPFATGGESLPLEPLGETQVELLLRRWLRHTATARRLAPRLMESCGGWPGRVVEAVRELARADVLRRERRGVVVTRAPQRWPDGVPTQDPFIEWARVQGGRVWGILELAAVQGAPDDASLLADAAGVRPAVAVAIVEEAAAARCGAEPDRIFESTRTRAAFRRRLSESRRRACAATLADVWNARSRVAPGSAQAFQRLRSLVRARRGDAVAPALRAALVERQPAQPLEPWALDALTEAAQALVDQRSADAEPLVAASLDRLQTAGRHEEAAGVADAWPAARGPASLRARLVRARHAVRRGRPDAADDTLRHALATPEAGAEDAFAFDAWLMLAELRMACLETPEAREALRAAGRRLHPEDFGRRGVWHRALALLARQRRRDRAARAHHRRAAHLLTADGQLRPAADAFCEGGGLTGLNRAADLYRLVGDGEGQARALYEVGRVLTRLGAHDLAVGRLQEALAAAEGRGVVNLLPRLHLALASVYRARGDLARERHHAEWSASLATEALDRVRSVNVLAQADLRAGLPAAERLLAACERDLRGAGLYEEAGRAQAALLDARLRSGAATRAMGTVPFEITDPHARLAAARLSLASGGAGDAIHALDLLSSDAALPPDLRAAACASLAEAWANRGRHRRAREAAIRAAALLSVPRRSQADDARLHRILARVFRRVDEPGRAVAQRRAARQAMRGLIRAETSAGARRRLVRSFWRRDPVPVRVARRAG